MNRMFFISAGCLYKVTASYPHCTAVHSIVYMQMHYAMYVLEAIRSRIYRNILMPDEDENSTMLTWRIAFV